MNYLCRSVKGRLPELAVFAGAAGRDFHNFNLMVRDNVRGKNVRVLAFSATQIPNIAGRTYPACLAGSNYPNGIPIVMESELPALIRDAGVSQVVFSYSDVSNQYVMELSARVNAAGASFVLPGMEETSLESIRPVIAVCAVRTGSGKSQTSRLLVEHLIGRGISTVAVRHPMPYGDLALQTAQRFARPEDCDLQHCTIEEREEYFPYIERGLVVMAGVDYGIILKKAEAEAQVVFWDGGNNDRSFYKPDFLITVADPLRPGHELTYYPGHENFIAADVIVINKVNSARAEDIKSVQANARRYNPKAKIIWTDSIVTVKEPQFIKGKRVLVIEDGPTVTHGGMETGAGLVAAREYEAAEIISPLPFLAPELRLVFEKYPHLQKGQILPAVGYGEAQLAALAATINSANADVVVSGTPIDLAALLEGRINKRVVRVYYESEQVRGPSLTDLVAKAVDAAGRKKANLLEI